MLWDIIRDFIVQNITGGSDSLNNVYHTKLGDGISYLNGELDESFQYGDALYYNVSKLDNGSTYYLPLSDWLATTLTIIAMCLIVAFAIWLVRWIFKAVSSAFLLKR